MKENLKLYVWDGVLEDYTAGIAFAVAASPKEAVKLLIEKGLPDHHVDGIKIDGMKPMVHRGRTAYHVYGGG